MRYTEEEINSAYQGLLESQSWSGTIAGSFIGAIPASALFFVFSQMSGIMVWFLFIPAALIAFGARYLGRPYRLKLCLVPALVSAIVHAVGMVVLFTTQPVFFITIPLSALVAVLVSKRKLSRVEETALWRKSRLPSDL